MSKVRKDSLIWEAYFEADDSGDEERRRRLSGAILECHKGFFINFCRDSAFPGWTRQTVEDYRASVLETALSLVPTYDPSTGASFITYVKPYLKDIRWRVHISQASMTVGVETARMRAALDELRDQHERDGLAEPTLEEAAAWLSARFAKRRKPVGTAQAQRLMSPPVFDHLDAPVSDGTGDSSGGGTGWDLLEGSVSPEDMLVADEETSDVQVAVRSALSDLGDLDDLDRTIIVERMMAAPRQVVGNEIIAPGPATVHAIGRRLGYTSEQVADREIALRHRLAELLKDRDG